MNEIERDGETARVESRSMQVLQVLLRQPGEVLSKERLLEEVWQGAFVTDEVLTRAIWELRRAFGDNARKPTFIRTVPKRGYCLLIAPETSAEAEETPETPETPVEAAENPPAADPTARHPAPDKATEPSLPSQRQRAVVLLGALLVATLIGLWWNRRNTPEILTIAVASFQNETIDPSLDEYETSLPILLTSELTASQRLRLLAVDTVYRTELALEKQGAWTFTDLGRELDADLVIHGGIFRAGEKLRLDVRIQAPGERHLRASVIHQLSERTLFDGVRELALDLRRELGEDTPSTSLLVTTQSPEALRLFVRGFELQVEKDFPAALPFYRQAVEADPEFAMAHAKLAIGESRRGWDTVAKHHAEEAFRHVDRLPYREHFYIEGTAASFREGTYDQAIDAFAKGVQEFPNHAPARHNLGVMHMELDNFDEAVRVFQKNMEFPPLIFGARLLGVARSALGQEDAARREVQAWIEATPDDPRAHDSLALVELQWNRIEAAREAYRRVEELGGSPALAWMLRILERDWPAVDLWLRTPPIGETVIDRALEARSRAIGALYRGRLSQAVEELDTMTRGDAAGSRALTDLLPFLAELQRELGRPNEAIETAHRAVRDGANDRGEWLGLAEIVLAQIDLERFDEARETLNTLAKRTANLPTLREEIRVHWLRGRLALAKGDLATAAQELDEARGGLSVRASFWDANLTPLHAQIWYDLGRVHRARDDTAKATEWFERLAYAESERLPSPLPYARALFQLGELYQAQGDDARAQNADRQFLALWQNGEIDRDSVEHAGRRASIRK